MIIYVKGRGKIIALFLKHAVFVSLFLAQVRERKTERRIFFNVEQHILSDALDQKLDVLYSALLV